jgi:hypothetical protein
MSNFGDGPRTGTATVPPPPRARLGRRQQDPSPSSPQGLPTRRRWGRFAAGAVLALLGAWIFASLYISAGERIEVLSVARDVAQYETIEDDDLRVVRVAAGPEVETIDADERDDIVGRAAAVPLREGSLLAENQVVEEDLDLIGPDKAATTIDLGAGPASVLEPGMEVSVVVAPDQGADDDTPHSYPGWVLAKGDPDEQTGDIPITVVVDRSALNEVAAADDGQVRFGQLGGVEQDD